ncbi:MAG: hypothetical protein E7408_07090 [Ruminococcaceae bacterium]|nr:hypothetical protein [Oscillospiraceae bacterium]
MKTAKAALFMGANKAFEIREFPVVEPKAGQARMRLIASGVCGTDVHFHNGKLGIEPPKIIGHEFVGRVDAISEADAKKYGISEGDAVISDIACPCGECVLCKAGDDANCVNMAVTNGGNPEEAPHFHGGYGEYSFAPVENLIKLPQDVDPVAAAVCACPGPTAIHGFALAEKANCHVENAKVAVVQGFGPVANFATIYLSKMGIKNIVVISARPFDEKKETLAKEMGATHTVSLLGDGEEKIAELIREISGGLGADVVFEGSGSPKAIPLAMEILRNRGVYIVPGQYSASGGIEIQPQVITFKALQILGSSQYTFCDVEAYVEFLRKNPDVQKMLVAMATGYKVEEADKAFADAKARKNIKTVFMAE